MRSTFGLAADFAEAEATGERRDLVQQFTRVDLLVLEDFGMKKLAANAAEDLLEVFVRRHEAASTLITTNRPTQDWGLFLGDVPAATAILDRFLAHATIIQMTGRSYRLRQRARQPTTTEAVDAAGAVDAQERAHRALEIATRFPQAPTAIICFKDRAKIVQLVR